MSDREPGPLPHQDRIEREAAQHVELRRRSDAYLEEALAPRLALTGLERISDRPRGRVWRAEMGSRAAIVKIYPAVAVPRARRSAALHGLIEGRGIALAELLHHDVGAVTVSEWGCGALVYERVPGGPPRRGEGDVDAACLANLARLHAIAPPDPAGIDLEGVGREAGERLEVKPLNPARETFAGDFDSLAALLSGPLRRLAAPDVARVKAWCDETAALNDAAKTRPSLLHGDYQTGNLIETPEGRLVTIDLDEVLSGPFHWELGAALLRCLWGTTSRRLDTLPLDALLSSPRLLAAEAAYLDAAPASVRDDWAAHRDRSIVAAYLRGIGRLALRSGTPERYPVRRPPRFRGQARRRWDRVVAYLSTRA